MLRTTSLKSRLVFSGAISFVTVLVLAGLSVYSLWQSELELERQAIETEAVRLELAADMMHDSIEASVVYAILRGPSASAEKQTHIKEKLISDVRDFSESIMALHNLNLTDEITSMVIELEPVVDKFISGSEKLIVLAFKDQALALAALPEFQKHYDLLEEGLKPLGQEILQHSAATYAEAIAHDERLLVMLSSVSVIALITILLITRSLSRAISIPMERMRSALREVAEGNFHLKVSDLMRADDFGKVARDIDLVSERVLVVMEEQNTLQKQSEHVIERVQMSLQRLSSGDLSAQIDEVFVGDYDLLRTNFNETVDKLKNLISEVVQASTSIQRQSDEVQSGAEDLSVRTESQAATLEETAAALEMITTSVNSSAQKAKDVANAVDIARIDVERSGKVVEGAVAVMTEIEKSSVQISQIIGVIDDIAFQTNLLALNAGVEAARAGEVGRGFAVVASEVGSLAQRSSDAANQIKSLIETSSKHVQDGVKQIDSVGEALDSVVGHVSKISDFVTSISSEAIDQAQGLNEVNIGVSQLDQVTQQNVSMVESSGSAILVLNSETIGLTKLVGQFVLRSEHDTVDVCEDKNVAEYDTDFVPMSKFG